MNSIFWDDHPFFPSHFDVTMAFWCNMADSRSPEVGCFGPTSTFWSAAVLWAPMKRDTAATWFRVARCWRQPLAEWGRICPSRHVLVVMSLGFWCFFGIDFGSWNCWIWIGTLLEIYIYSTYNGIDIINNYDIKNIGTPVILCNFYRSIVIIIFKNNYILR